MSHLTGAQPNRNISSSTFQKKNDIDVNEDANKIRAAGNTLAQAAGALKNKLDADEKKEQSQKANDLVNDVLIKDTERLNQSFTTSNEDPLLEGLSKEELSTVNDFSKSVEGKVDAQDAKPSKKVMNKLNIQKEFLQVVADNPNIPKEVLYKAMEKLTGENPLKGAHDEALQEQAKQHEVKRKLAIEKQMADELFSGDVGALRQAKVEQRQREFKISEAKSKAEAGEGDLQANYNLLNAERENFLHNSNAGFLHSIETGVGVDANAHVAALEAERVRTNATIHNMHNTGVPDPVRLERALARNKTAFDNSIKIAKLADSGTLDVTALKEYTTLNKLNLIKGNSYLTKLESLDKGTIELYSKTMINLQNWNPARVARFKKEEPELYKSVMQFNKFEITNEELKDVVIDANNHVAGVTYGLVGIKEDAFDNEGNVITLPQNSLGIIARQFLNNTINKTFIGNLLSGLNELDNVFELISTVANEPAKFSPAKLEAKNIADVKQKVVTAKAQAQASIIDTVIKFDANLMFDAATNKYVVATVLTPVGSSDNFIEETLDKAKKLPNGTMIIDSSNRNSFIERDNGGIRGFNEALKLVTDKKWAKSTGFNVDQMIKDYNSDLADQRIINTDADRTKNRESVKDGIETSTAITEFLSTLSDKVELPDAVKESLQKLGNFTNIGREDSVKDSEQLFSEIDELALELKQIKESPTVGQRLNAQRTKETIKEMEEAIDKKQTALDKLRDDEVTDGGL